MHKILYFAEKKILKKMCVPTYTLPKIFRPITRNTLIFLFGLNNQIKPYMFRMLKKSISMRRFF